MNFAQVLATVCGQLDAAGARTALIGGFAMALQFGLGERLADLKSIYGATD